MALPSAVTNFRLGRLAGGDGRGRLPIVPFAMAIAAAIAVGARGKQPGDPLVAPAPIFDAVLRRPPAPALGMGKASASCISAAMAATVVAPGLVMLFRRLTRWFALRAAPIIEWEPVRECGCRLARPLELLGLKAPAAFGALGIDGRWVNGLAVCCIS